VNHKRVPAVRRVTDGYEAQAECEWCAYWKN
jgi:hypothetical protein